MPRIKALIQHSEDYKDRKIKVYLHAPEGAAIVGNVAQQYLADVDEQDASSRIQQCSTVESAVTTLKRLIDQGEL